jgi:hypothetical protein
VDALRMVITRHWKVKHEEKERRPGVRWVDDVELYLNMFKIMKNKGFGHSRVGICYEENQGQNSNGCSAKGNEFKFSQK